MIYVIYSPYFVSRRRPKWQKCGLGLGSCGVFRREAICIIVMRVFRDNSNDLCDLYKKTGR